MSPNTSTQAEAPSSLAPGYACLVKNFQDPPPLRPPLLTDELFSINEALIGAGGGGEAPSPYSDGLEDSDDPLAFTPNFPSVPPRIWPVGFESDDLISMYEARSQQSAVFDMQSLNASLPSLTFSAETVTTASIHSIAATSPDAKSEPTAAIDEAPQSSVPARRSRGLPWLMEFAKQETDLARLIDGPDSNPVEAGQSESGGAQSQQEMSQPARKKSRHEQSRTVRGTNCLKKETNGRKRQANSSNGSDEGDDDGNSGDDGDTVAISAPVQDSRRFACPFAKLPLGFLQKQCRVKLKEISHVKCHIRTVHPMAKEKLDAISKRVDKTTSREDQWYSIYRTLFPGELLCETPYVQKHEEEVFIYLKIYLRGGGLELLLEFWKTKWPGDQALTPNQFCSLWEQWVPVAFGGNQQASTLRAVSANSEASVVQGNGTLDPFDLSQSINLHGLTYPSTDPHNLRAQPETDHCAASLSFSMNAGQSFSPQSYTPQSPAPRPGNVNDPEAEYTASHGFPPDVGYGSDFQPNNSSFFDSAVWPQSSEQLGMLMGSRNLSGSDIEWLSSLNPFSLMDDDNHLA
ncbi:hypothetical protein B0T26DRAFT_675917 [Lasiosphaeria miniovina]|uniref:Uncharacterized protein n=1 Tax=Lasiosphaeria miniovina TaxID=1954250 RepID=A0AA40AKR0_9PEZI|nr:uncharacterized protein B0T26DRAFT_675917 [Lasiosphaeria miniovina]KAK0717640.1 hypothetical protein B0T26DRAFT_675917 [Lasiosphaeria miniovina]